MNYTTYIFGELSKGYSQYPEDSSSNLFKDIQSRCTAPSRLVIHRDGNMMYYVYVRKLEDGGYIGLAIVINGYYFTRIKRLFAMFEKEMEMLVEKGVIIHLNNAGEIVSSLSSLLDEEEEVNSVLVSFQTRIDNFGNIRNLPPVDYSISADSQILFNYSDKGSEIVGASYRYGFTVVLKESDYDSIRTTSFKNILRNLSEDKNALIKENEELRETNRKIQRQKKQFRNVVLLVIVVIGCAIGLYFLNQNLNDTQEQLDSANSTISLNKSIIKDKDSTIMDLRDSVRSLRYDLRIEAEAKENLESSLRDVCSYAPFAVTGCEVDDSHFKFDYYCPFDRMVTVTLKAVSETYNDVITSTYNLSLNKGKGTRSLEFSRGLSSSQYYYVVLMYDGNIIAGKRW